MSRARIPTERERMKVHWDSTRSSEGTVTVERLGFAGGRVLETKRSEPSLRKVVSERALRSRATETRRESSKPERETTTRSPEKFALEKERLAVEKEILELERERVALDRKKLKIEQEHGRVTNLIELLKLKRRVWSRGDLEIIEEELEKVRM